jgi:hypothetical protein
MTVALRVDQNLAAFEAATELLQWPWNGAVFSVNEKINPSGM